MSAVVATVVTRPLAAPQTPPPPPHPLMLNTSLRGTPAAVPNKHLPVCSPGPRPQHTSSPNANSPTLPAALLEASSLLHPPTAYRKVSSQPPVYSLTARQVHAALAHMSTQPLPDPALVFPWLHGLHPENNLQLAFFIARKRALRRQPGCMRSITIVKAGGNLASSKLRGAITPEELLQSSRLSASSPQFHDPDPKDGFSVRNFQIQATKMASVSDIIVYGDDETPKAEIAALAQRLSHAQKAWRGRDKESGVDRPLFSTFMLSDTFAKIEEDHPDIIAIGSNGCLTGNVLDFFHSERVEMQSMSQASQIADNVWLGPSPDVELEDPTSSQPPDGPVPYDVMIECNDMAQPPNKSTFKLLDELLSSTEITKTQVPQLEFPASGSILPPTWSQIEVDSLINTIAWIYDQANGLAGDAASGVEAVRKRKDSRVSLPSRDADGDSIMGMDDSVVPRAKRKLLLHCSDGYTETTLLAAAYYMYAHCVPLHQAYLELHRKHNRNFFSYPTDVSLLTTIQPRILQASPLSRHCSFSDLSPPTPSWMTKVDGSLPSRIMPYMYLGNLNHANNPGLLREMGIGQVLSIGETVDWTDADKHSFCEEGDAAAGESFAWDGDGKGKWMFIGGVQDNGVDPLTDEFERCLDFIRKGRDAGVATLVHCRVGVSRSATICIAEVMNELGYSFPKAYCFVRARRLNVIIQPHLRFSYELLKYEEHQAAKRGVTFKRELEWATIAREIAAMNRPYSRQ